jgi:hypothetical protein
MNIVFHDPRWVMSMGIGQESGFRDVPEETFMRSMPAGFMSCPNAEIANKNKIIVLKTMGLLEDNLLAADKRG